MSALERFLVDGYLEVTPTGLSPDDHETLYASAADVYRRADEHPGDTDHLDVFGDRALLDAIPDCQKIIEDPAVVDALTELLGKRYFVHPHCFLHRASQFDQVFHQDGNLPWNERGHYRPHRADWALLFYYPQAVTPNNGPTEIVPGSQYWTKDFERDDHGWHPGDAFDRKFRSEVMESEDLAFRDRRNQAALDSLGIPDLERKFVTIPTGQVVICNYDLVHRGSRQMPGQKERFMYKFYFARTQSPEPIEGRPQFATQRPELAPVVSYCQAWHMGQSHRRRQTTHWAINSEREDERVAAAYRLAAGEQVSELLDALVDTREAVRRAAAYGLRALDARHAEALLPFTGHDHPSIRRLANFALGNAANAVYPRIVANLTRAIEGEEDDLARSNAAYSLGQIGRGPLTQARHTFNTILARLEPGTEPDNTRVAGLPRSTVRQSLAYAALQIAANHPLPLSQEINSLSQDGDRYVAGFFEEIRKRLTGVH